MTAAVSIAAPPLIDDAQLQNAGMFRYWQADLPLAVGDRVDKAELRDDTLYVTTMKGTLFSVSAETGLVRWGAKVAAPDDVIYSATPLRGHDDAGPVVIPTTSEILIYNRYSGALIQRTPMPFAPGSAAVGIEDRLYLGSADGLFYSLQLDLRGRIEPVKRWEVRTDRPVTAAPLLTDAGTLIFATHGGTVYACFAEDKTLRWAARTTGAVLANPALGDDGVYVASMDRSLYKFRLSDGRLMWRVRLPRPLEEGPVLAGGRVFQYCPQWGLSALDPNTGEETWRRPDGRAFLSHSRGNDIIMSLSGKIEVVASALGQVQYTIDAPEVDATVANTHDDAVYLLAGDGRVLCARVDTVPYLRRQQVIAARRVLNVPPEQRGQGPEGPPTLLEETGRRSEDPFRSRHDRQH